jgi:MoxR-like ATPase
MTTTTHTTEKFITGQFRTACRRCGKPIQVGTACERYTAPTSKRRWGVHDTDECRAAAGTFDEVDSPDFDNQIDEDDRGLPEVTLDDLVKTLTTELLKQTAIDSKLEQYRKSATDKAASLIDSLQSTVTETINDALDRRDARVIKLVDRSGDDLELGDKEHYHQQFEEIARHCDLRRNIFLFGATGAGKTHTAEQLSRVVLRDDKGKMTAIDPDTGKSRFGFISCTEGMSEAQLTGRFVPAAVNSAKTKARFEQLTKSDGMSDSAAAAILIAESNATFEFMTTLFIECFEKGGLFLLDEFDSVDPNVALIINSAISNGELALPNRMDKPIAKKHADFILIVAGNTDGTGGDRQYTGRNTLDASTLRRFRWGMVKFEYDEKLERKLCPETELFELLTGLRKSIDENRLEHNVCTGDFAEAYNDVQDLVKNQGLSKHDAIQNAFKVMTLTFTEDELERTTRTMIDNGITVDTPAAA